MNQSFLVANWKMHCTAKQTVRSLKQIIDKSSLFPKTRLIICPPFTSLAPANRLILNTPIALGAQTLNHRSEGPYTGEISPQMISEFCDYVILGHSERRLLFGETSHDINLKSIAAIHHALQPIICLDGQSDSTRKFTDRTLNTDELVIQLLDAIKAFPQNSNFLLAYEPTWAIGSGEAADPVEVNNIAATIREVIFNTMGSETGLSVPILYGGSVTLNNINDYSKLPEVNGALVGGASLDPEQLVQLATTIQ